MTRIGADKFNPSAFIRVIRGELLGIDPIIGS